MKRYRLYDPPEYVGWQPSDEVQSEFEETLKRTKSRLRLVEGLSPDQLLDLYRGMVRFRLHDIALKRWVRQGVLSKAWLGTGEEAVTIGTVKALRAGDYFGPMIRNAGGCREMGMPLQELFSAYLATDDTHVRGRDLHIGDLEKGVVAPISHVGSLMPVFAGLALGARLKGDDAVALTYVGDGSTKVGEVHEAMSFAAVRKLPLVMVVQANQVALGTRTDVHSGNDYRDLGRAYGVKLLACAGNNVLDTYAASVQAVDHARSGKGAAILLAETFRMGGHATHDEAEARRVLPEASFAFWGARDPIGMYEQWLMAGGRATPEDLTRVESEAQSEVAAAETSALESRDRSVPDPVTQADGVFAPSDVES